VDGICAFLKKEASNSNVNISMAAIAAAVALANGMKTDFASGIKILIGPIFLKFKEKRPLLIEEVNNFATAVPKCSSLEEVKEEFVPLITNVAPGVKVGVIKFVEKTAQITYIDVMQRCMDDLMPAMVKAIDDKDGTVRETALHCMGILKGRLGEKSEKYIKDVNKQKMEKIDEAAKEIKPSKYDRPENWKPPPPKVVKKAAAVVEDDDALMSFDAKPKRAPPKGIGVKPKKKVPAGDEEMEDVAPPKPPARKPPALSSNKPKAAASSGKAPSAPQI